MRYVLARRCISEATFLSIVSFLVGVVVYFVARLTRYQHGKMTTLVPTPTVVLDARDSIVTVLHTIPAETPTGQVAQASKDGIPIAPIVGGLVGGIVGGLLIAGLLVWCLAKRKKRKAAARKAYMKRQARLRQSKLGSKTPPSGHSTTSSLSSQQRLTITPTPSEKLIDFSQPATTATRPRAPSATYSSPKIYDRFMSEKGYGYEPKPLDYVDAGGEYLVQEAYEPEEPAGLAPLQFASNNPFNASPSPQASTQSFQTGRSRRSSSGSSGSSGGGLSFTGSLQSPSVQGAGVKSAVHRSPPTAFTATIQPGASTLAPQRRPSKIKRKEPPQLLPPLDLQNPEPSMQSSVSTDPAKAAVEAKRKSRVAERSAAADKAAAKAMTPLHVRSKPARPSPLAKAQEDLNDNPFNRTRPSPQSSISSGSMLSITPSFESGQTSGYTPSVTAAATDAAAVGGTYGIALGSPTHDQVDFAAQQEEAIRQAQRAMEGYESDGARNDRTTSGQYHYDPFAEYHAPPTREGVENLVEERQGVPRKLSKWI